VAILLECILVPIGLFIALGPPTWVQSVPDFNGLLVLLAVLAVVVLTLLGANAFVAERVNQTLDVLLATPLTAREIMSQKASVAYRLLLAGLVPAISLIAIQTGNRIARNPDEIAASLIFAVTALGVYLIDLPLAWWFALWLSVKSGTRRAATMWALGGVFGLLVLPSFALDTLGGFGEVSPILAKGLVCLSPWETLRMAAGQTNRYGGREFAIPFW
jgi:ABC-type transport system involved in multi-copper enzyme maturation permease subunit